MSQPETDEALLSAAKAMLEDDFRSGAASIIEGLSRVGHIFQPDTENPPEPLNARYVATETLGRDVRLGVALDVTVVAIRFQGTQVRPIENPTAPGATADWSAFSSRAFAASEFRQLASRLQDVIEVDLRARLWGVTHRIARAQSTDSDDFRMIEGTDDGASEIDFVAFSRRLHLGFTFVGTVWDAAE